MKEAIISFENEDALNRFMEAIYTMDNAQGITLDFKKDVYKNNKETNNTDYEIDQFIRDCWGCT